MDNMGRIKKWSLLAIVGFAALLTAAPFHAALAATAPSLGSESTYGVVSSTFTNSNTSPFTNIDGDICYTTPPTAPPLFLTGATVTPCPPLTGVHQGLALADLNTQCLAVSCTSIPAGTPMDAVVIGANPPGTFPPGCYRFLGALDITASTTVTLNGAGVYVFCSVGALATGANSIIALNGVCEDDVFWAPVGATTLGATSTFAGNILDDAGISIGHFTTLLGRALAFGGTVTTDADTITVPPVCVPLGGVFLGKSFSPATINEGCGGSDFSTLTITLSNPNATAATITSLIDTLPAGTQVAGTPNYANSCGGTTFTPSAGDTILTMTDGTISGGTPGTCTLQVDVCALTVGANTSYVNTLPISALVTSNGNNTASALATLVVLSPGSGAQAPTISKIFSPVLITEGDTSTLSFTLSNPSTNTANSNIAFTDTLPPGLVFAGTPAITNSCNGSVSAAPFGNTVTLTGGSIAAASSCTITVDVVAFSAGSFVNTLKAGALTSDQGANVIPAVATLTVTPPPIAVTLGKSFSPATINAGGVSLLTITVTNPNLIIATPVAFTDFLPSSPGQMLVATGPQTNTCNGTLTATTGSSSVSYAGGLLPAGDSCTVAVYVTAPVEGAYTNHLGTASATLTVPFTNCGSITIIKDAVPDGPQDFRFGGNLGTFFLDDDLDPTLPNTRTFTHLAFGLYNVQEIVPAGWKLQSIVCADPNGGTTVDLATATARISIDACENVICKFVDVGLNNELKPQRTKITFYYENVPLYNGKDSIDSSGYLMGTGSAFQMPFNKDVTVEYSIDPLRFPPTAPRVIFKETIKAGTVKPGSTRYRYLKSGAKGINELSLEKTGNNAYLYVWINYVNLLPDLKATLSQADYLAFVRDIKSYNLTVRIGDQTWSGNFSLTLWYFGEHRQQLVLNP